MQCHCRLLFLLLPFLFPPARATLRPSPSRPALPQTTINLHSPEICLCKIFSSSEGRKLAAHLTIAGTGSAGAYVASPAQATHASQSLHTAQW